MATLPSDVIEDILRRLPVKSLKRFRAVAKWWCNLIDSEKFVKLHLLQSLISCSNRNLLLGGLGVYSIDLESLDEAHAVKPPFHYKSIDGITNTCNGLILVMSEPPVMWNPSSRSYRILPKSHVEYPFVVDYYAQFGYGFGYDSKNDDYKVLKVVEFRNKTTNDWMYTVTEIYSSKSNRWKKIERFPYALPYMGGNSRAHVNGAFHTLVYDTKNGSVKIMAFSVESEQHYEVAWPPGISKQETDVRLSEVGGYLCVICPKRSRVIIWIMKEYGVKESWTKLLSVGRPTIDSGDLVKPLVFSRDRAKVLLNCDDKKLVWYDLDKKTVSNVSVKGLPFVFYAESCVESLVSLEVPEDKVKKQVQVIKKEKKMKSKRDDFLSKGFKLVL